MKYAMYSFFGTIGELRKDLNNLVGNAGTTGGRGNVVEIRASAAGGTREVQRPNPARNGKIIVLLDK